MSEPTPADRELFIYVAGREDCAEDVLIGNCFTWEVDAITKYRIAAMEAGARMMQEAAADWLRGISDPGATFQDRRLAYQLAASQFAEEIAALDPAEVVKEKP